MADEGQTNIENTTPQRINGILPLSLSNLYKHNQSSVTASLARIKTRFSKHEFYKIPHSTSATTLIGLDLNVPIQEFATSENLINSVRAFEQTNGSKPMTEGELLELFLKDTEGSVRPDFSGGAINDVNSLYYQTDIAFSPEGNLASSFVENIPLNTAISRLIKSYIPKERIKIKELSSGSKPNKWVTIAKELSDTKFEVELTDFSSPSIPDITAIQSQLPNMQLSTSKYSLFDHLQALPDAKKLDAMFITYGFDSVWLNEDVRFIKESDKWYKEKYRVKVLDTHPRRLEIIDALKNGKLPKEPLTVDDFKSIAIEQAVEEVTNIDEEPYGDIIRQNVEGKKNMHISVPGGLVSRVVEGFTQQLRPDGVFIIGDTVKHPGSTSSFTPAFKTSGVAAKYKVEDYGLAKNILEKRYGYIVEIIPLKELATRYLDDNWARGATEEHRKNIQEDNGNCIMVVRNPKKD